MPTGKVKWYDAEKGFGFLSQDDGPDVYVRNDALPDGPDARSRPAPAWSSASPRAAAATRRSRCACSTRPPSVVRNQSHARRKTPEEMAPIVEDLIRLLDGVGEAYRHGRHPDARAGEADGQAAARARRRARALTGLEARLRTSRSLQRGPRPAARTSASGFASTNTDQASSTTAATIRPSRGWSGIAMPTKPPITHASCSVVSLRAKAGCCTRSGTSRWIVESSDSLARHWASPAVKPSTTSETSP